MRFLPASFLFYTEPFVPCDICTVMAAHSAEFKDRPQELTALYLRAIEAHLQELRAGRTDRMMTIRDVAERLFVHPVHLGNTIKRVTGRSPCDLYEDGIVALAKEFLADPSLSAAEVARRITMDPSNFTKYFKRFVGMTPGQYRERLRPAAIAAWSPISVR